VGIRKHRRPGGDERQTPILKTCILGALRVLDALEPAPLDCGRRRSERGNAPVRRIGDDRGAKSSYSAGAELAEEGVVGSGPDVLGVGVGWSLLITFSNLTSPRRGLFGREERLVLQLLRPLE